MARRLKVNQQIKLLQKIFQLHEAGIHQDLIAAQLKKHGSELEKQIAEDCLTAISLGKNMSPGLKEYLSPNAYLSLLSGERVGEFGVGIKDAIRALNMQDASTIAVFKALYKPILSFVALVFISAAMSKFAFPNLEEQVDRAHWKTLSLMADAFGQFWLDYGLLVGGGLMAVSILIGVSIRWFTGEFRTAIDDLPVFRQYRFIHCANMLTTLAHQMSVGEALKPSLEHYQLQSGKYISYHIDKMLNTLQTGRTSVGDVLDTGLLIDEEMDTLKLLGKTIAAADTLKRSANLHHQKLTGEVEALKVWGQRTFNTITYILGAMMVSGIVLLAFDIITGQNIGI
ncbi:hypothetical protein [Vibrio coralliilyticus]|uniref:hypothetical protein n=1 Tax=Vibrio coralliilyticus TaxID=190893 RepID=UPI000C1672C2|nr:hypothetical protein [Vibrio coralliilyticus]